MKYISDALAAAKTFLSHTLTVYLDLSVMALPFVFYFAIFHQNWLCICISILCLMDILIPLSKDGSGYSPAWCRFVHYLGAGKEKFFPCRNLFELPPEHWRQDKNYLLCLHPHSLYFIAFDIVASQLLKKSKNQLLFFGADVVFKIPVFGRLLSWAGGISVSKKLMRNALTLPYPKNISALITGGIAEMFSGSTPDGNGEIIVAKRRKGHIRMALETGTNLVPCYCFGANDFVHRLPKRGGISERLSRRLRAAFVPWLDAFYIPMGPFLRRTPLLMVIGTPIEVEKNECPSDADVQQLHQTYLNAMVRVFNDHKAKMGEAWKSKELFFEDYDEVPNDLRLNCKAPF